MMASITPDPVRHADRRCHDGAVQSYANGTWFHGACPTCQDQRDRDVFNNHLFHEPIANGVSPERQPEPEPEPNPFPEQDHVAKVERLVSELEHLKIDQRNALAALEAENVRLTGVVENYRTELDREIERRTNAQRELSRFHDAVREVAIQAHKDGHWCRQGMNEKLGELGLDEWNPSFEVDMTISVRVTVDAETEDAARDAAYEGVSVRFDGDFSDYDDYDYSISSVEPSE